VHELTPFELVHDCDPPCREAFTASCGLTAGRCHSKPGASGAACSRSPVGARIAARAEELLAGHSGI